MGYKLNTWILVNKYFKKTGLLIGDSLPIFEEKKEQEPYYGLEMLELGCQGLRRSLKKELSPNSPPNALKHIARKYFSSIGINCLSIDIKGCYESLKIDLREPINSYFHNKFDIVTNAGTTEHIYPIKGQYEAFKNIHLCTKKGGIMIHFGPLYETTIEGHSPFYYKNSFFKNLAKLNNYKIIDIEVYMTDDKTTLVAACLKKINNKNFTTEKNKFFKYIHQFK